MEANYNIFRLITFCSRICANNIQYNSSNLNSNYQEPDMYITLITTIMLSQPALKTQFNRTINIQNIVVLLQIIYQYTIIMFFTFSNILRGKKKVQRSLRMYVKFSIETPGLGGYCLRPFSLNKINLYVPLSNFCCVDTKLAKKIINRFGSNLLKICTLGQNRSTKNYFVVSKTNLLFGQ